MTLCLAGTFLFVATPKFTSWASGPMMPIVVSAPADTVQQRDSLIHQPSAKTDSAAHRVPRFIPVFTNHSGENVDDSTK